MQKALSGALDLTIVLEPFLRLASNASNEDKSYLIVDNPAFMGSLASLIQTRWTWGAIHDYLLVKVIRR